MTVLHQIASSVGMGEVLGLTTLLFLIAFVGWTVWAWAPSNKLRMEQAARIPLDEDDDHAP